MVVIAFELGEVEMLGLIETEVTRHNIGNGNWNNDKGHRIKSEELEDDEHGR